jgi:hypothetical protein
LASVLVRARRQRAIRDEREQHPLDIGREAARPNSSPSASATPSRRHTRVEQPRAPERTRRDDLEPITGTAHLSLVI